MTENELKDLSDQQLLEEAKKIRKVRIQYAVMIGFLIGIVIFSFAHNSWGFLTLIPLYFAYKLIKNPDHNKEVLDKLLKERKLK